MAVWSMQSIKDIAPAEVQYGKKEAGIAWLWFDFE